MKGQAGRRGGLPVDQANTASNHYCEGAARLQLGSGFFRPQSRPSRDLGVLVVAQLARESLQHSQPEPLAVLDAMAGCGIRALRYGLEALEGHHGAQIWANDADSARLPLLEANLAPLAQRQLELRSSGQTAQYLLAACLQQRQRFDLVDLDAFGCPSALVPLALEAVKTDGVLYLASTDGRSPTGHDRPGAIRMLGAGARAHPASWELALRLQLGVIARAAWAMGRGIEPLLAFSEGRTFRTAVRLRRHPAPSDLLQLGLLAHCHGCGDQQVQALQQLRQWQPCLCLSGQAVPLAVSGPLWTGALQHPPTLLAWLEGHAAERPEWAQISPTTRRLLAGLAADHGEPARCWPTSEIGRRLRQGPPRLVRLARLLQAQGYRAQASGVMAGQLRSDAPWAVVLEAAKAAK